MGGATGRVRSGDVEIFYRRFGKAGRTPVIIVRAGDFFGPQAAEYGYAWYLNGSDFTANGFASGKKNP